jgi:hypothetical protein
MVRLIFAEQLYRLLQLLKANRIIILKKRYFFRHERYPQIFISSPGCRVLIPALISNIRAERPSGEEIDCRFQLAHHRQEVNSTVIWIRLKRSFVRIRSK